MSPNLLTLLDPHQPILYTGVFAHLNVADTVSLLATCRQTRALKAKVFNVNVLLRPFFKDPREFRQIMADNDLMVGGSVALRLFSRENWKSSDIDVYTESESSVVTIADFLEREKYHFTPYFWQTENLEESVGRAKNVRAILLGVDSLDILQALSPEEESGTIYGIEQIKDIYAFIQEETEKRVEVVLTRGHPVKLILSYYSTHLMNFFSYRAAYSLFPSSTFHAKTGYYVPPAKGPKNKTLAGISKYLKRGYTLYQECPELRRYNRLARLRTVGDCNTWCIHFPTDGITAPPWEMRLQGVPFTVKFRDLSPVREKGNRVCPYWVKGEFRFLATELLYADYLELELAGSRCPL